MGYSKCMLGVTCGCRGQCSTGLGQCIYESGSTGTNSNAKHKVRKLLISSAHTTIPLLQACTALSLTRAACGQSTLPGVRKCALRPCRLFGAGRANAGNTIVYRKPRESLQSRDGLESPTSQHECRTAHSIAAYRQCFAAFLFRKKPMARSRALPSSADVLAACVGAS